MTAIKSKRFQKYKLSNVIEAFEIISKMLDANDNLGLTQLSNETLISKNKTFRLLSTLEQCGIVEKTNQNNYKIGIVTIGIARKIMAKTSLLDSIRPYMEVLTSEINEAVYFAYYSDGEAILIDYVDCCHPIKVASLVGKVLLPPDSPELDKNCISASKVDDITVVDGGLDPEITSISTPFFDEKGVEIGALVVLVPTFRATSDKINKVIIPALRQILQRRSFQLPTISKGFILPSIQPIEQSFENHTTLFS